MAINYKDVNLLTELAILVELWCHQQPSSRNDDVSFRIVSKRTDFFDVLKRYRISCSHEDGKKALSRFRRLLEAQTNDEGLHLINSKWSKRYVLKRYVLKRLVPGIRSTITALLSKS